ncbi:hypothetical protein OB13_06390 [Pontibacter sp. HJ8]
MKELKRISILLLLHCLCSNQNVVAQSPNLGFRGTTTDAAGKTKSLPANNPWIVAGAQLGYKIGGNDEFAEGLIGSGRVQFQALEFPKQSKKLGLPMIGNISKILTGLSTNNSDVSEKSEELIQELITSSQGLNFGLYPYYEWVSADKVKFSQITFYGSAAYKLNAARDLLDSSIVNLHQGRFSVGFGWDLYIVKNSKLPLSLSAEPVMTVVKKSDFERVAGTANDNIFSLELTGIFPLSPSVGFLGQWAIPNTGNSLWRIGLIFIAGPSANENKPVTAIPDADDSDAEDANSLPSVTIKGRIINASDSSAIDSLNINAVAYTEGVNNGNCAGNKVNGADSSDTTDDKGEFEITLLITDPKLRFFEGKGCVELDINGTKRAFAVTFSKNKDVKPSVEDLKDIAL